MPRTEHLFANRSIDIERAVILLREGGLVAVPTETVYGLAADAQNEAAVAGIFRAKGRPSHHPLIVHLAAASSIDEWAREVPDSARRLAAEFWPGPLTLLLRKAAGVSARITGDSPAVGLRVPAQPTLRRVLELLGRGIAAPSANPYRRLSPTTAEHVLGHLSGRIDAVLDDGPCAFGLESTIVDLSVAEPVLVRPGPISKGALEAVLGRPLSNITEGIRAPGTEAVHYQPRARVVLLEGRPAVLAAAEEDPAAAVLLCGDATPQNERQHVLPADARDYARGLYGALHVLDASSPTVIYVQAPPRNEAWRAVNDRLGRAAATARNAASG